MLCAYTRLSFTISHCHTHTHADSSRLTGENIHCQCEKWSGTDGIRMIETTYNGSHNFPVSLSLPHSSTAFSLSTCPLPRSRPATTKPFQCQPHSSCQRGSGSVEAPRHHTKSAKRRKRGGRTGEKKKRGGEEDAGVRLFYFSTCLRFFPPCVIFSPSIFGSLHCLQQLEITNTITHVIFCSLSS